MSNFRIIFLLTLLGFAQVYADTASITFSNKCWTEYISLWEHVNWSQGCFGAVKGATIYINSSPYSFDVNPNCTYWIAAFGTFYTVKPNNNYIFEVNPNNGLCVPTN